MLKVSLFYGPGYIVASSKYERKLDLAEDLTELSGYVKRSDQIRAYQESGVLLHTQRALQYDYDGLAESPEKFSKFFNKLTTATDLVDLDELTKRGEAAARAKELFDQQAAQVKKDAETEKLKHYEEELSVLKKKYEQLEMNAKK